MACWECRHWLWKRRKASRRHENDICLPTSSFRSDKCRFKKEVTTRQVSTFSATEKDWRRGTAVYCATLLSAVLQCCVHLLRNASTFSLLKVCSWLRDPGFDYCFLPTPISKRSCHSKNLSPSAYSKKVTYRGKVTLVVLLKALPGSNKQSVVA